MAELRPLVFIASFIGLFVLLVGVMVSESPDMFSGQTYGESFIGDAATNPLGLVAWNETYCLNLTDTFNYEFNVANWNVRVQKWSHGIYMETFDWWWIFNWNFDGFHWFKDGIEISKYYHLAFKDKWLIEPSQLNVDYAANKSLSYQAKNSKTQWEVAFGFNETKFASPSEAYFGNEMSMIFNLDWNDRNTGMNALTFVSQIFTFSLPGMPTFVNLVLWVMIFPSTIYLAAIFVLKIIGAVFGGG